MLQTMSKMAQWQKNVHVFENGYMRMASKCPSHVISVGYVVLQLQYIHVYFRKGECHEQTVLLA